MSLYQLEHLTRAYGRRIVLAIDQLEIEAGRMYALLGPNGAGKTTLLNLLAFLDEPTSGSLRFHDKAVGSDRAERLALRRQVVLVDQHPIMFSTSVAANIEFGLKIRKIDRTARQRAVQAALETVGLERYREARAHELSGGETQRLALARALALAPTVLLCDEPTASVDTENQAKIAALLRRINTYLVRWARKKYRALHGFKKVKAWWRALVARYPRGFAHWAWTRDFLPTGW